MNFPPAGLVLPERTRPRCTRPTLPAEDSRGFLSSSGFRFDSFLAVLERKIRDDRKEYFISQHQNIICTLSSPHPLKHENTQTSLHQYQSPNLSVPMLFYIRLGLLPQLSPSVSRKTQAFGPAAERVNSVRHCLLPLRESIHRLMLERAVRSHSMGMLCISETLKKSALALWITSTHMQVYLRCGKIVFFLWTLYSSISEV